MLQFDRPDYLKLNPDQVLSKPVAEMSEVISAARKNARFNDQSQSSAVILKDIWEPVVDEINDLMGTSFYSPTDHLNVGIFGVSATPGHAENRYRYDANKILTFIADNKARLPDNIANLTLESIQVDAQNRARQARADYEDVAQRSFGFNAGMGAFLGGAAGVIEDPMIASSGPIGIGAKSIWKLAIGEALIGAGVEAVAQTGVREWYKTLGYEYTYQDFLRNVGYGAAGGAVLPVALRGGREAVRLTTDQAKKGIEALRGSNLTNEQSEALADMAEALEEIEADNPFVLTPEMRTEAEVEHSARLEEGRTAVDVNRAPAISDEPTLPPTPEAIAAATDNLDNTVFSIPARDLTIDAKRFQFKEGGDEYGVTERLQGVMEWDAVKAGTVIFWEDASGKIFIADGHQRAGLARRIMAQDPSQDISLIGYKLRETDDISAEQARVIAAMANIAQGTGTVIDAAKVLRVDPSRIKELPPRSELVRQARDMVNLSDRAFGAIINQVIPANYGAIVGRLIDDPDLQDAAISVLAKAEPANAFQAEAVVRQVREAEAEQVQQVSLFGEEVVMESFYTERAKILDRAYKQLRQDKKAFESLTRNADRLEAEGNRLARNQNQRRAEEDGQAIALLQTLANRKGTLSDELTAAARSVRETGNYAAATRNFVDAVGRAIKSGDFDGAATGDVGRAVNVAPQSISRAVEDEPILDGFDEPTGVAAREQADQMVQDTYGTMFDEPEAGSIDELKRLLEGEPTREQIDNHPAVVKALDEMGSKAETINVEGYGSIDWHTSRTYRIEGEDIIGTENALARFEQDAEALAFKELKTEILPVARDRELTIVLGPPAAGKSTIANELAVANRSAILDSDEIKKALPEYEGGVGAAAVHEESSELAKALQSLMIERGTNIVLPKVGHTASSIRKVISLYKEQGYKVRLVNMDVTPENAYQRMIMRFVNTGRIIPPSYLDAVGSNPTATYRTLKAEGAADGYAEIDNNGGFREPKEITDIEGDNPLARSRFDLPKGSRTGEGAIRRAESDSEELSFEVTEAEMDLEIPVDYDNEGNPILRTLRDIKSDVDAEDALVSRLEFCGL